MGILQKWFIILRAYSWPASIVPMAIASAYAYKNGWFSMGLFFTIFIAGFLIHLSGNLFNTYYDYINGVDRENADDIGIVKGLTKPEIIFKIAWIFISIASIIGLILVFKYSLYKLLIIASIGILFTILYTANPISLKYRALGEIVIFLCFGPLIVLGSVLIYSKEIIWQSIWYSIPSALLIVNILLSNNIRDIQSDSLARIKTIVHIIGERNSVILYIALHILSYIISIFITGFSLLYVTLLPLSLQIFKLIKSKSYSQLNRESAKFVLVFGIIFIGVITW